MNLFVYGTLMRGQSNEDRLSGARFIQLDRTRPRFSLVNLGPYPGLLHSGSTSVRGEVYEVDDRLLTSLDEFEDHPNLYLRTLVELESGLRVFAYVLRARHAVGAAALPGGDWRERGALPVPCDAAPPHRDRNAGEPWGANVFVDASLPAG